MTDEPSTKRGDKAWPTFLAGAAVLLIVAVTAAVLAAPDITWLDSSELAASAFTLGIAHPPGHPLPALVGHLVGFLPLGTWAFRCNLASSLALGLAALFVMLAAKRVAKKAITTWSPHLGIAAGTSAQRPMNWIPLAVGSLVALTVTLAWSALLQGIRTEVYALQMATASAAVAFLLAGIDSSDVRPIYASGLALGLALSNHHLLGLAVALPCAVAVVWWAWTKPPGSGEAAPPATTDPWRRLRPWLIWTGLVGLGLSMWAYLPIRAARFPLVDWGHPTTLSRFLWTVTARLFARTAEHAAHQSFLMPIAAIVLDLGRDLGWFVAAGSLLGLWLGLRKRASASWTTLLAAIAALTTTGAIFAAFDPTNPDSHGYVMMMLAMVGLLFAVAAGPALAWIAQRRPKLAVVVAAAAALILTGRQLARAPDMRHALGASAAASALCEMLPPGTLFLSGYHETQFLMWEVQSAEGARPDVCAIYRHDLTLPGAWTAAVHGCPDLAQAAPGTAPDAMRRIRRLSAQGLMALASRRFVAVEPDSHRDDPFPVVLGNLLHPAGPIAFLAPQGRGVSWNSTHLWAQFEARIAPWQREEGTKRYLLWRRYQDAVLLARQRRCQAAWPSFRRAWSLSPKDPLLVRFAKACFPHRRLP
ncbi:MAG: DUF2723 domain-containing protein [Deltaproteobacteria bacterium]|nr:DUF2723 domain-containing protein [Deltaproteobacteria bacterium]